MHKILRERTEGSQQSTYKCCKSPVLTKYSQLKERLKGWNVVFK